MAAICSVSVAPTPKSLNPNRALELSSIFFNPKPFLRPIPFLRSPKARPKNSESSSSTTTAAAAVKHDQKTNEESMNIDTLHRFIDLNLGNWTGSLHQFDPDGNLMHKVTTKLAASSYGADELISLIQTLYIKLPPSSTSISGDVDEPEWAEYKLKETNMFTVDKYQQFADWLFPQ